jgi:hypothetical protein
MLEFLVPFVAGSPLNTWIVSSYQVWPALEIIHFLGITLLFGGLLVIDLRMAGYVKSINPVTVYKLVPVVVLGFSLCLVTGILFFYGDPATYAGNLMFQLKVLLIMIAGLNVLLYNWKVSPLMVTWTSSTPSPAIAKLVAYASLGIWTAVLLCGRLIPYISGYSGTGI